MRNLPRETLLNLLAMYEAAIRDLEKTHDPRVAGMLHRLERRRGEVIGALAEQYLRPDESPRGPVERGVRSPANHMNEPLEQQRLSL